MMTPAPGGHRAGKQSRRGLAAARECINDACRLLETGGLRDVRDAERRFGKAADLLRRWQQSASPEDARQAAVEAAQLHRDGLRAGRLLDALAAWQQKLAVLLSSEDLAMPGYAASGRSAEPSKPGSLAILG